MHPAGEPLDGRHCLVTGANTGIGLVTARELARRGAQVTCACRSPEAGRAIVDALRAETGSARVTLLVLDLGSLESVRVASDELLARGEPLHVLVNNAGVAGQRGATADGFELAFGVNHLGHFLLTRRLLPLLMGSAPSRIVTVSSHSHYRARGIDYPAVRRPTTSFTGLPEYQASKLANVLFSAELARRLAAERVEGVRTYSLHPGTVATDVWRRIPSGVAWFLKRFMLTPEEGARTTLYCATSPDVAGETGAYYASCRQRAPSRVARDRGVAAELWRTSEEWVRDFA